jgi:hypothetical protein
MLVLSEDAVAALAAPEARLAQTIEMDLASGPLRVTACGWDLRHGGNTFMGGAQAGSIEAIEHAPAEMKSLRFGLQGVDSALLALAMSEPVQGREVTVCTAIFDDDAQIIEAPVDWQGRLDVVNTEDDGTTGGLTCAAESIGIDLLRPSNVMYSNQDQLRLFPGDRGFEYVVDQADQEIVWPESRALVSTV